MSSLLLSATALFCCVFSMAQEPAPQVRIVDRIDDSRLVKLQGNTHPMARAQYDRGRVSPDLPMGGLILVFQRSPEQQAAFDRFVESQNEPGSPNYHQWLEPEEVGERFGPALGDIDQVENWLHSHGFTVGELANDRMSIRFSGTAGQVESAFHTEIHNLDVKGEKHIANMTDPSIPAALAPVVAGPKQLHNFNPHPLHRLGSKVAYNREKGGWERLPEANSGAKAGSESVSESGLKSQSAAPRPLYGINDPTAGLIEDVTPYDFATIYNVLPVWNKSINGAGQTIAIAGTSEIDESDLATFRHDFGLPVVPSFKQVQPPGGIDPGQCGQTPTAYCTLDDQIENSLDTEWSGAVAPGADLILVASGENASGTIDTVYESASYVVNDKIAPILNVSYGLCELFEGTVGNKTYNSLWETASSEGISVFVAAGDSGSATCDAGGDAAGTPYAAEYGLSVSGVASTPYNTAVGGTDFAWCDPVTTTTCTAAPYWGASNSATGANALNYVPEIPWNATCTSKVGLEFMQYWANQLDVSTPSDAEMSCNFAADPNVDEEVYDGTNGEVNLANFVDTIGGSGGKSNCTINSFNPDGTVAPNPTSCSGGYGKPSWQAGVTGIPPDGRRDLPDVSFFASSGFLGSAYLICVTPGNAPCTYSATAEDVNQEVGGTSASSPAMAGVMALINQKAGAPQGNPNAQLYKLAATENYSDCSAETVKTSSACYFNDVDTQSNIQVCDDGGNGGMSPDCQVIHSDDQGAYGTLEGWVAARGFDLATGLGSLNVANVVNAWPVAAVPAVTLSASTLTFKATLKGTASAAQVLTLKNSGHGALTLSGKGLGIAITGTDATSFSETNTCGTSVAVGASCTIKVTFKPVKVGTLTASLGVGDNAFGSPQTVALTGTGAIPEVKLSSTGLTFAATAVGSSAASQIILSNSGDAALSLTGTGKGISIQGENRASFHETNNCGTALAAGKSCTITVTFKPKVPGPLSAEVAIADDATASPQSITLKGTGSGPVVKLSASSLVFSSTAVGKKSAAQAVKLENSGNIALSFTSIALAGANTHAFIETNNCGKSLAVGKSCTITVTFDPPRAAKLVADVSIADNAAASPQEITLTGTVK
jgi:subtilase family serine protease